MNFYSEVGLTTERVIIYVLVYEFGWDQSQSSFENTQITYFNELGLQFLSFDEAHFNL